MRELLLNVFHTSDLHFGEESIVKDFHFPGQFEDYFSCLKDTVYEPAPTSLVTGATPHDSPLTKTSDLIVVVSIVRVPI